MLAQASILHTFHSVSLEEVNSLKGSLNLLKRHDTKFVCQRERLKPLLTELTSSYDILEIDGKRAFQYENLYFDTADFSLYHHHHNQNLNRYKFRYRRYVDSDLHCWEVKFKSNKEKTDKSRFPQSAPIHVLTPQLRAETRDKLPPKIAPIVDALAPALWIRFSRLTLTNNSLQERLTIDVDIEFENMAGKVIKIPEISVIELKQHHLSLTSPFVTIAKQFNVFPKRFSKYCTGIALLGLSAKVNRFKFRLRTLNKLSGGKRTCLSQT